nr:hypothetical protein [Tanacetum cinerariifolium]
ADQFAGQQGGGHRLGAFGLAPGAGRRHHGEIALRNGFGFDAGMARVLQRQRQVGFAQAQRVDDLAGVKRGQFAPGLREMAAPV